MLAGTTTVGCRRCGEGPAGETFESNVVEGLRVALREQPDVVVLEGSGAALPPVRAHATVCVTAGGAGAGAQALSHLGPLRLLRSDLLVVLGAADLVPPARRQLARGPRPLDRPGADRELRAAARARGAAAARRRAWRAS